MGFSTQLPVIIEQIIDWLTNKPVMSENRDERRRTRALFASVVLMIAVTGIGGVISHFTLGPDEALPAQFISAIGILLYVGLRFIPGEHGRYLTITLIGLMPYIVLILMPAQYPFFLGFAAPILAVMLASQLLPLRQTMLIALINLCSLTFLSLVMGNADQERMMSLLVVGFAVVVLAIMNTYLSERERYWQTQSVATLQSQALVWEHLLASLPDATLVHSAGVITYANRAATILMEAQQPEELIGAQLKTWFANAHAVHTPRIQRDSTDQMLSLRYPEMFSKSDKSEMLLDIIETPIYFQDRLSTLMTMRPANALADDPYVELNLMRDAGLRPAVLICRDDQILFAGMSARRVLGRSEGQLVTMSLTDCVLPAHRPRLDDVQKAVIVLIVLPDGTQRWVLMRRASLNYNAQAAELVLVEVLDALGKQPLSQGWFAQFIAPLAQSAFILRVERSAAITAVASNAAAEAALGYAFNGQNLEMLLAVTYPDLLSILQRREATQQTMALHLLDADGHEVSLSCVVLRFREVGAAEDHYILMQSDVSLVQRPAALGRMEELLSETPYALQPGDKGQMRFTWLAGPYEAITGYTLDELMNLSNGWESLIYEGDIPLLRSAHRRLDMSKPYELEYRIVRKDGNLQWVQDAVRPVWDEQIGGPLLVEGSLRDISNRIRAEEALRTHIVQQAVVAELGMLALTDHARSDLLNHTLLLIEQVLDVRVCEVWEYLPSEDALSLMAQTGYPSDAPKRLSAEPTANQAAYVLAVREPVLVHNPFIEMRFTIPQHQYDFGLMSSCSVIVYGHETPFGVINVHTRKQRHFTDDDIYFLQSVANVLGAFIEQNRMQEAEHKQREFADALRDSTSMINAKLELPEVMSRILEFVAQVVPALDASMITLLDESGKKYRFMRSRGYSKEKHEFLQNVSFEAEKMPLVARMIEEHRSIIVDDTQLEPDWVLLPYEDKVRSYLGAPIFLDDQCIGIIHLESQKPHAFTQVHAERLMAFADKTGLAILNARRTEDLERSVRSRTDELKSEREQVQAILDATGEGIIYVEEGSIRFVNRATCELTGFAPADFAGKSMQLLIPANADEAEHEEFIQRYEASSALSIWRGEFRLGRADGSEFIAGLTISQVSVTPHRSVTIVRDISREKELEAFKARFIANAAHELRSPITNLNTRLYLIRKQPAELENHVAVVERVVVRMNRLVSDLLDMAYLENGRINLHREAIILQEVVGEVVSVQSAEAARKQIELGMNGSSHPVHILGDPHRLMQVFTNLIVNAITYTPEGGKIHVSVELLNSGEQARVAIADTGYGIAQEDADHIFTPFFRVDQNHTGTGLGLSIAQEIVELHHGNIRVESTPGEGSCFIITLPALRDDTF